jgi:hypothetical protein
MHRRSELLPKPEGTRYWSVDLGGQHGAQWFRTPAYPVAASVRPLRMRVAAAMKEIGKPFEEEAARRSAAAMEAWSALPRVEGKEHPEPPAPLSGTDLAPPEEVLSVVLPLYGACIGLAWHGRAYALDTKPPSHKATADDLEAYGLAVVDELQDTYTTQDVLKMGAPALKGVAAGTDIVGEAQKAAGFSKAPTAPSSS